MFEYYVWLLFEGIIHNNDVNIESEKNILRHILEINEDKREIEKKFTSLLNEFVSIHNTILRFVYKTEKSILNIPHNLDDFIEIVYKK